MKVLERGLYSALGRHDNRARAYNRSSPFSDYTRTTLANCVGSIVKAPVIEKGIKVVIHLDNES